MKIIKIERKKWWQTLGVSIDNWWAWVEHKGEIQKFGVWANDAITGIPIVSSFLWDLKRKIEETGWEEAGKVKEKAVQEILALQGQEIQLR